MIRNVKRLSTASRMIRNPNYTQAKAGSMESALLLVDQIFQDKSVFSQFSGWICPVQKPSGNKIPLALAIRITENSSANLCDTVFLISKREGNPIIERMHFEPHFAGVVPVGKFTIIDDVFTTGITLKGLQAYIELSGSEVVKLATIGTSRAGTRYDASQMARKSLKAKFPEIDLFFNFPQLTFAQVNYLMRFSSITSFHNRYIENQSVKQFC